MLRLCQRLLHSLPFVPMALSTLDTLEQRMEAAQLSPTSTLLPPASVAGTERADLLRWFSPQCTSPFFVSPKHDGVRLVSYVPPSASPTDTPKAVRTAAGSRRQGSTRAVAQDATTAGQPEMTCYSRYGRPIYGLFWIEEELRLLRCLSGDARLIVDGELYLHHTHMDFVPAAEGSRGGAAETSPLTPAQSFKTGFLAVSALVHRLRGSSSQCATESDILHYVPALPNLCIFDIPSYSPCRDPVRDTSFSSPAAWSQRAPVLFGSAPLRVKERRAVEVEVQRVRRQTMQDLGIRDVEQLRIVPNITPFSLRLRTLTFLLHMLESAMASPVLKGHFCPSSTPLRSPPPQLPKQKKTGKGKVEAAVAYHGGQYVQRIPYEVATSLADVQQRVLPRYLRQHYEGAVIRTPVNPYDFAEKRRGTLDALVAPLLRAEATTSRRGGTPRLPGTLLLSLTGSGSSSSKNSDGAGERTPLMVRAYPNGVPSLEPLQAVTPATAPLSEQERAVLDAVAVGAAAVQRGRRLPRRSETAVKILAYHDREYAILRPLLKEPSRNPNTRELVSIPRSTVAALGYPIKPDAATLAEEEAEEAAAKGGKGKGKKTSRAAATASPVVVFYGLQCLSESGLAFNVTMPKLTLTQQKALLDHLLTAGRRAATYSSSSSANSGGGKVKKGKGCTMASLTGLYATVKFSCLTEHGIPRFGTVKAIRGGKGWFM